jgi:hypothetical protein
VAVANAAMSSRPTGFPTKLLTEFLCSTAEGTRVGRS